MMQQANMNENKSAFLKADLFLLRCFSCKNTQLGLHMGEKQSATRPL